MDVPAIDSTISANIRVGKANKISTIRLRSRSTQPPHRAANRPKIVPAKKASITATNAMAMVLRAPYNIRVYKSRPR